MSTTYNLFSSSRPGVGKRNFPVALAVLWGTVLALALAGAPAQATVGEAQANDTEQNVVAVFRLEGPLTEAPAAEDFPLFGQPGTTLQELVAALGKAANDSAVKAVV